MSDVRQPTAVVFDVGRVIIRWQLRYLFEKLIDDPRELDWFLANVVTEQWHHQHDEGRSLAEMLPERIALFPRYEALIRAYAARFPETCAEHVPGTLDLIARLGARGVPLFGLTNFGADFWPQFRAVQPVFDGFRDIVVSGHEKCAKPEPRIYAIAEARFGLPPEALFFIDDKAENVAAAQARGWHGHVFTDAARLEEDLRERGLLA
ncbi:HAD-IA family hydrolase [Erythrobacter arachoides]|uniref:HAD-IA family hydrolase n=1 Tax=Aurantiacibacter arachoides TaxID=1850444 RepID=A0A844ZXJ6_9SPHN|nr:HAD family phosphatase [Aurantiacibacter arachoides]MXO92184.1 HAD-IA family hydrolase [Aurantiacibacter arachoides]GGD59021.1 hydrolase [Aurantiacibacter arachoides]